MAIPPNDALARLAQYNGNAVSEANPFGFGYGGHRTNFPQALYDTASVGTYVATTSAEITAQAQAVVDNLALTVTARNAAQAAAGDAAASAAAAATFEPANYLSSAPGSVGTGNLATGAVTREKIAPGAVTFTELQNVATARFLGRVSAGDGPLEPLTAGQVRQGLSIANVDNTSDANKPVSTATQTALNGKVAKTGDTMTGTLEIGMTNPTLALLYPSVKRTHVYVDNVGNFVVQDQSGQRHFVVGSTGALWSQQLGDVGQRIEDRSYANANALNQHDVREMRFVLASDVGVVAGWNYYGPNAPISGIHLNGSNGVTNIRTSQLQGYSYDRGWFAVAG